MANIVSWNGVSYTIPEEGEENWAGTTKVDGLLVSLATNGLQKTGGNFTLSADIDFGGTAGLKSTYYKSRNASPASAGQIRLGNAETIQWRNAADSANKILTVDSSDRLTYAGTVVFSSAGVVPVAAGGTGAVTATLGFDALSPMTTLGDIIYGGASGTRTRLAGNTTTTKKYLSQTGDAVNSAAPAWAQTAFADLSGNATAVQGGTGITSYTIGDILYADSTTTLAKLGVGASGTFIKSNGAGAAPTYASPSVTYSYKAKTHADTGYTILITDDYILWTLTNASNDTATFPSVAALGVKKLIIKLAATTAAFNTLTISRAGSDTITLADGTTGATSLVFYTGGETYELVGDGVSVLQVTNHRCNTAWTTFAMAFSASSSGSPAATGTISLNEATWRRVGDTMEVSFGFFQTSAGTGGTGNLQFGTPGSQTIDSTKITLRGDLSNICGYGVYSGAAAEKNAAYPIVMLPANSTNIVASQQSSLGGATNFDTIAAGVLSNTNTMISFKVAFPITGWKA